MFREASFGHGELKIVNSAHAFWSWHRNDDDEPVRSDQSKKGLPYLQSEGIGIKFLSVPCFIDGCIIWPTNIITELLMYYV
ncbi:hypothetical protein QUC31_001817 [Theobroma cacao]